MLEENIKLVEMYNLYLMDSLWVDFEDAIDSELLTFDEFCNLTSENTE